jgi:hypothetical protein
LQAHGEQIGCTGAASACTWSTIVERSQLLLFIFSVCIVRIKT